MSLLRVDLTDFFGSITSALVKNAIRPIFADCSKSEVDAVVSLCCYKGFLPQGSPASPILSNLVCWPLDERLEKIANDLGCMVTRYSDDIYFSSKNQSIPHQLAKFYQSGDCSWLIVGNELQSLVAEFGFKINQDKLRLQMRPFRLQVTGLIVRSKLVVPVEFRRCIRAALHHWAKYGIVNAAKNFHPNGEISHLLHSLIGRISYIGQVAGKESLHYQNLAVPFARLLLRDRESIEPYGFYRSLPLERRCHYSGRVKFVVP